MMIYGPMPTPTPYKPRVGAARVSAPPPRRAATSSPRAPARAAAKKGGIGIGFALRFGKVFYPQLWDVDTGRRVHGCRGVMIAAGALDASLRAARKGTRRIRLLCEHDPNIVYCDTSDGSLKVWADEEDLMIQIDGTTRRGRLAIAMLKAIPTRPRQLSIGAQPHAATQEKFGGVTIYRAADLTEISVVEKGSCPGTRLTLL